VRKALEGLEGVTSARVDLATGRAVVDYREGTLTDAGAIKAIKSTVVLPRVRRWMSRLPRFGTTPVKR
jgi:copper chaperone CopZ